MMLNGKFGNIDMSKVASSENVKDDLVKIQKQIKFM